MKKLLMQTTNNREGLIIRFTIACVMFPHGVQMLTGWFNGPGFSQTYQGFTEHMHLPGIVATLVILLNFFIPLFLLLGLFSRLWALVMIVLVMGMIVTVHAPHGFFMNWFGTQKGEGFEYHLLLIGLSLALVFTGSGAYSADAQLQKKMSA